MCGMRAALSLALTGSSFFLIGGAGAAVAAMIAAAVPQAALAVLEGKPCAY
jgi:hypothetical protein